MHPIRPEGAAPHGKGGPGIAVGIGNGAGATDARNARRGVLAEAVLPDGRYSGSRRHSPAGGGLAGWKRRGRCAATGCRLYGGAATPPYLERGSAGGGSAGAFALPFENENEGEVEKDRQCGGGWCPRTNSILSLNFKKHVKRRRRFL